jgi:serine/threonine protein kinase
METATASQPLPASDPASATGELADPCGLVGSIVDGRYLVERVVGRGGFGVVYRAHHLRFESPVALKVLLPRIAPPGRHSAEFGPRFLLEGKLLFTLSGLHPSIVSVFEMGMLTTAQGAPVPYMALEWLDGEPLDQLLERNQQAGLGPYSLPEALALLDGPVRALSLAHARRIAHRDVKPANLFVVGEGERRVVKLLDFGIAKAMGESTNTTELFADSGFVDRALTPGYAAPEQWLARFGATGTWSDVFSLALVCVELLSGKRAIDGNDSTQLMGACIDVSHRPTPRTLGVAVSDHVEAVFARALAVDPRARFRDAGEFWEQLCSAAGRGWSAPAHSIVVRSPRRRRSVYAALAIALAGLGVGWALLRPTRQLAPVAPLARSSEQVAPAASAPTLRPEPTLAPAAPAPLLPALSAPPEPVRTRRSSSRRRAASNATVQVDVPSPAPAPPAPEKPRSLEELLHDEQLTHRR